MSMQIPPVAVLVAHRVADFDTFKKVFDGHQAARKEASCLGHDVNRGVDDPNMVYVYCPATDVDKLRDFVDSPELVQAMKAASVEGPPTITMMTPKSAAPMILFGPARTLSRFALEADLTVKLKLAATTLRAVS